MSQGQCYGHPGEDLSQQVHNTAMRPAWSLTLFLIKSVIMKKENDVMIAAEPAAALLREAVVKAERDFEDGKCLTEADFKERFAKWL